ncbi:MAG: YitT family protein [Clostridiaceae bacterium]|nr:YitT family protein [Clostridiaceae bacterium]
MKALKAYLTPASVRQHLLITLGALIYACGQLVFIKPLHIPMGGVAGISLVLNYLFSLPVGVTALVLNLPLFALGYKFMGREFFIKTVFGVAVSSVFLDALAPFIPAYTGDMLLSALYGGIVMGGGFGLIFRGGGTSGGTDIIAKYLNKKRDMPIGTFNFSVNAVIILLSALIYKNIDSALYAIITSYLSSTMIDRLVYGLDAQRNAFIVTGKPEEVSRAVMEKLKHGVTAIPAKGMYTGDDKTVLMCVVRRHEAATLKVILREQDEHAFMLLGNISEVFGKNFKRLED